MGIVRPIYVYDDLNIELGEKKNPKDGI